jgi:hypothetical protein
VAQVKLFVSYRRSDSRDVVIPLCERLEAAFGADAVFRDEEAIGLGGGFIGSVGGAIHTADAILVVIGPDWLTAADSRGRRRIDDKDDVVRMEVGLALASGKVIIPLLAKGAAMPSARELPRAIRNLAGLAAFTLDDGPYLARSVDELVARLGGPSPDAARPGSGSGGPRRPRRNVAWTSFEGRWQMRDGSVNEILQSGQDVELSGEAGGVRIRGEGRIIGSRAVIDCRNSLGLAGRLDVELTEGGAYLTGVWSDRSGRWPVQLMRRT